ncbi:TPA: hypothetical protein ACX6NV_000589 [Photobacterium damselae]
MWAKVDGLLATSWAFLVASFSLEGIMQFAILLFGLLAAYWSFRKNKAETLLAEEKMKKLHK